MTDSILSKIAKIIAPHLHSKHKDSKSLELAEEILKEIKKQT
jgi:hypothetical protein